MVQGLATLAVVALVARSLGRNWAEFRSVHTALTVKPAGIAASLLAVSATYVIQIEAWRSVLRGWGQHIGFGPAARAWALANLGRYVPGKVWSVAGLVVLARRAGVQVAPAAASAFVSQAIVVGAGAAVVAAVTRHAASPLRLAAAGAAALATVGVLVWKPTARWLGRLVNATAPLEPLRAAAALTSSGLAVLGWLGYGAAFWLLANSLVADRALPFALATGVFALGYILGWLAPFAPGGVGVRELVLISLLTPFLGSGGAVAVSIGSRVLLTVTEAGAALASVVLVRRAASEESPDSSRHPS